MDKQARRAKFFAENLENLGLKVTYPGLDTHPDHQFMSNFHCPDYDYGYGYGYGYGDILTLDLGSAKKGR